VQWAQFADRVGPILAFLLCINVVAELADRIGVFAVLADHIAVVAGGSVVRLWGLVVMLATVCTAVLSLDTTAVLLTPVVLALAAQLNLHRALFAYTTIWLANTASLVLPVSNLTNLLAVHVLQLSAPGFIKLTWPAALTAIAVTVVALAAIFRRSLRGRYTGEASVAIRDRPLLVLAMVVCGLLGPAYAAGLDVTFGSAVAALMLVIGCLVRAPDLLSIRLLPWQLLLGVGVLFVAVQFAHDHGLGRLLGHAAGTGTGWLDLLRLTGVAALGANVVDNLPSYLAVEPATAGSPIRLTALLVGVNTGSLITPWASLATLLWAGRCRAADLAISWRPFILRGIVIVPVLLAACTTAVTLLTAK
jgi:arsenical pump membrane protein